MKPTVVCLFLMLFFCLPAQGQTEVSPRDDSRETVCCRFSADLTLSAGLNGIAPRSAQLAGVCSADFGRFFSAGAGVGLRYIYALEAVDRNIYGFGEEDQQTYGRRLCLPLFLRLKGIVPAGKFTALGTSFTPFVQVDAGGYVYNYSSSRVLRFKTGSVFAFPAVGLDMRLSSGNRWSLAVGAGFQQARYQLSDHAASSSLVAATAVSLDVSVAYSF